MTSRALAVALIAICNFAAKTLEKAVAEDGDGDEGKEEKTGSRSSNASRDTSKKGGSNSKGKDKDDDSDDDAAPSEDDIIDAVRAAQKVLEKKDVVAILKKHGKSERATEVDESRRQAVIDALEKAVDEADQD
jgi:hypothetical protein